MRVWALASCGSLLALTACSSDQSTAPTTSGEQPQGDGSIQADALSRREVALSPSLTDPETSSARPSTTASSLSAQPPSASSHGTLGTAPRSSTAESLRARLARIRAQRTEIAKLSRGAGVPVAPSSINSETPDPVKADQVSAQTNQPVVSPTSSPPPVLLRQQVAISPQSIRPLVRSTQQAPQPALNQPVRARENLSTPTSTSLTGVDRSQGTARDLVQPTLAESTNPQPSNPETALLQGASDRAEEPSAEPSIGVNLSSSAANSHHRSDISAQVQLTPLEQRQQPQFSSSSGENSPAVVTGLVPTPRLHGATLPSREEFLSRLEPLQAPEKPAAIASVANTATVQPSPTTSSLPLHRETSQPPPPLTAVNGAHAPAVNGAHASSAVPRTSPPEHLQELPPPELSDPISQGSAPRSQPAETTNQTAVAEGFAEPARDLVTQLAEYGDSALSTRINIRDLRTTGFSDVLRLSSGQTLLSSNQPSSLGHLSGSVHQSSSRQDKILSVSRCRVPPHKSDGEAISESEKQSDPSIDQSINLQPVDSPFTLASDQSGHQSKVFNKSRGCPASTKPLPQIIPEAATSGTPIPGRVGSSSR